MVARVYARTSVHAQMVTMDSDVQEEVGESRGGGCSSSSILGGCWSICPAIVTPCPSKIVDLGHFAAKTCPAVPIFALQGVGILIVRRMTHSKPPL